MNKISCGQLHSCFIGKVSASAKQEQAFEKLFVWGNNTEGMLCPELPDSKLAPEEKVSNSLQWPTEVKLSYANEEYEAVSVSCGPTYTFALGKLPAAASRTIKIEAADE